MSRDASFNLPNPNSPTPQARTGGPAFWQGFATTTPLPLVVEAEAAPEPQQGQGAYGPPALEPAALFTPSPAVEAPAVELLSPAGGLDAACAAIHFGADAVYLGLKKFSARAEAENFSLEEVDALTAFAHAQARRRRIFVTVNTLVLQHELGELIEALGALSDIGVDALIVQDLGVYGLVRKHFPELELHASTQMAVHNRSGAQALKRMGFSRVVLARELTFEEVRDITATAGIETEVFVHGALCYSYSGLCLFSAQTIGRSGNRGKCAYTCRDSYTITGAPETLRDGTPVKRDPASGFPFSMKDLALPEFLPALRDAGVSCFKIEGRKKSPLYVATTTDYYRKLLDGTLPPGEHAGHAENLQTVFSRPWTSLFLSSHREKEVADRDATGHRGAPIGTVESVQPDREGISRLRFRTSRRLERHDGLQIDIPALSKPLGFAVEGLWRVSPGARKSLEFEAVFETEAGSLVEVALPEGHPPIPIGAPIYCSSSQWVKQHYRFTSLKPGQFRSRRKIGISMCLDSASIQLAARAQPRNKGEQLLEAHVSHATPLKPAREAAGMEQAARGVFEKMGATRFCLDTFTLQNPQGYFAPVSLLNSLRRQLLADLEAKVEAALSARISSAQASGIRSAPPSQPSTQAPGWSIKVDKLNMLDAFEGSDWDTVEEIVVDLAKDPLPTLEPGLLRLAERIGRERIRLALPALTRKWEDGDLRRKIERLGASGWKKWEAANLGAWSMLDIDPLTGISRGPCQDLSADWPVYAINRAAVLQILGMGATRVTLSPEDGLGNMRELLAEFGRRATVIVHQDTPLFVAESCAYANLIGGCPGKANCRFESMEMVSSYGEKVTALDYHCRTIVINRSAYCLAPRLRDLAAAGAVSLRADFIYRPYAAQEVREAWRQLRAGKNVLGGHAANFDRGLR